MTVVEFSKPASARAAELVDYLTGSREYPFARLADVAVEGGRDVLDIVVEPQLAQDRVVPILPEEPIRLVFDPADGRPPWVHSQRDDFPLNLVHTMFDEYAGGLNLCVWEESWAELKRGLTAQALIERIRDWLSRTARGDLHQAEQALEPLLPATADTLIIPAGPPPATWHIVSAHDDGGQWTITLGAAPPPNAPPSAPKFAVFSATPAPQVHGAMQARPRTLSELDAMLAGVGTNFVELFGNWLIQADQLQSAESRNVVLVILFPKVSEPGAPISGWEHWAFMPVETLAQLGAAFGRTLHDPGTKQTTINLMPKPAAGLDEIRLQGWRIVQRLDRAGARRFAGNDATKDKKLVAIGAGAIGSNVIMNTIRAGVGSWTIVDDDIVLPHNTVRQFQGNPAVGFPKAFAATADANHLLDDHLAEEIRADFLAPAQHAERLLQSVREADLVFDFSASPAVLGELADTDGVKRCGSIFFNPDGSELVVLAEDKDRQLRLDEIEAQYFYAVASDARLDGHFTAARLDRVRYANACQDLSRPLPPWQVQTLCGIAAGQVLSVLAADAPAAQVWRLNRDSAAIAPVPLQLAKAHRATFDQMRVTVTDDVLRTMRALREASSPNETGGVLIGSFDLSRSILHIVAALPAPPDSRQSPTYFVRGAKDLKPIVDALSHRSAGVLSYVGEWHSHPDRAAARPSGDDEKVFGHLASFLDPTGAPYAVAICGQPETWLRIGWHARSPSEFVIGHDD